MKLKLSSSTNRILILFAIYSVALFFCNWLSYELRFDGHIPREFQIQFWGNWSWVLALKLWLLVVFGQFSGLLSYFSLPDMRRLLFATTSASGILLVLYYNLGKYYNTPRGVVLIDYILALVALTGIRLSFRIVRERSSNRRLGAHTRARRVAIIGAGSVGASLARDLISKRGLGLQPVAFFDDDENKWHSRVHDISVIGAPESIALVKNDLQLQEVIIAMPSAPAKRVREIVKILQKARLKFETVPSIDQLAMGKVKVSQLRSVEIQDLLGRDPIVLETENIRDLLKSKVVMVTGAGGSIGSELCRQIAGFNPSRLLLIDQSEVQLFQIEQELIGFGHSGTILPLIADVLDANRMRHIFQRYKPAIIFHAAAHKHVPMMESQPGEAIKNNAMATAQMAEFALEFKADRFVLISTDKAINPTNVMGATKRLAETFVQSLHATPNCQTRFMAVRFGNVLGSSGSVIPTFQKQIAAGGPVRVTHADVTRYFMTIPEAVGLVLQSGTQGEGGEIFVLDMGSPVKIVDLAKQLIELNGLTPGEDIEIEFIGLRPGEKLFEELSHKGEHLSTTNHQKIMRFNCQPLALKEVRSHFAKINARLHQAETNELKHLLKEAVPEYQPFLTE